MTRDKELSFKSERWFIAAAGFWIYLFIAGSNRANGLIYVGMMDTAGYSRQVASYPFAFAGAAAIFVAPIMGFLSSRFSVSSITFYGVFLAATGSAICMLSNNIFHLTIFYGIVKGTGVCMCTVLLPGLINNSFKNHKATAMGIITTGTHVGAFLYPFIVNYLMEQFNLGGTFLLMGGISLHAIFGSIVLARISRKRHDNVNKPAEERNKREQVVPLLTEKDPTQSEESDFQEIDNDEFNQADKPKHHADQHDGEDTVILYARGLPPQLEGTRKSKWSDPTRYTSIKDLTTQISQPKKPVFNKRILKRILTCRGFYLGTVTQLVTQILMNSFNLVIADYMLDKGIGLKEAVLMLNAFGVGQVFARLCLGWITDKKFISRQAYIMINMSVSSAIVIFITFSDQMYMLLIGGTMLGILQGSLHSVSNVVYSDYLDKEEMQPAMSISRSLKGLVVFIRAPLFGFIRDSEGSYDFIFLALSGVLILISVTWMVEVIRLNRERKMRMSGQLDWE